jgi:hypothetical protein
MWSTVAVFNIERGLIMASYFKAFVAIGLGMVVGYVTQYYSLACSTSVFLMMIPTKTKETNQ